MIHRNRGNRRWRDHQKAERKQKLSQSCFGFDWFHIFGKYDKGKIHCSCPLCRAKTKDDFWGTSYSHNDQKKLNALKEREEIFNNEEE